MLVPERSSIFPNLPRKLPALVNQPILKSSIIKGLSYAFNWKSGQLILCEMN
ncbi:hypothetical protein BH695_1554 [Microcystis aeruginosa PCC 7806SL]|uniref:Uncharacterized protein n=1 Tax=Microcystis aeruginosa PCC 7806SL TaxID=1903187 RepID=A0AB33BIB5_MICA7|nr:hypothetical protein BH695_1554 [Microcystis aeruginosa PCC 7806SL]